VGQLLKDRRGDPRYGSSPEDVSQATLRPGCVVHVVDLSAGGALVQATRPLRPGARLHFQLVLRDRSFALVAHVLRCAVWALDQRDGITYRGALQFETRCELFRETETQIGSGIPAMVGRDDGEQGMGYPGRDHVREMSEGRSAE
jgi:PilZ domain-containing protein